jgi:hypothetical protein
LMRNFFLFIKLFLVIFSFLLFIFSCIGDRCSMLCFECDKVFHKSNIKNSHIRVPVGSFPVGSTAPNGGGIGGGGIGADLDRAGVAGLSPSSSASDGLLLLGGASASASASAVGGRGGGRERGEMRENSSSIGGEGDNDGEGDGEGGGEGEGAGSVGGGGHRDCRDPRDSLDRAQLRSALLGPGSGSHLLVQELSSSCRKALRACNLLDVLSRYSLYCGECSVFASKLSFLFEDGMYSEAMSCILLSGIRGILDDQKVRFIIAVCF